MRMDLPPPLIDRPRALKTRRRYATEAFAAGIFWGAALASFAAWLFF